MAQDLNKIIRKYLHIWIAFMLFFCVWECFFCFWHVCVFLGHMCLCVCVLSARPDAGSPLGPCSPLPKSLETSGHRRGPPTLEDALASKQVRNRNFPGHRKGHLNLGYVLKTIKRNRIVGIIWPQTDKVKNCSSKVYPLCCCIKNDNQNDVVATAQHWLNSVLRSDFRRDCHSLKN